ncbi:MAG: GGDEF domain-containing protein [Acidobacteriota bacterium]
MRKQAIVNHEIIQPGNPRERWNRLSYIAVGRRRRWKSFVKVAQEEFERASTYGDSLSLALVRLDCFPEIVRRLGPDGTTHVLRGLASTLLAALRRSDVFDWVGDGYFAILFVTTRLPNAVKVCERIGQKPASLSVIAGDTRFHLTVSFGLTAISREDWGVNCLVRRAAKALRMAKRAGGNRVCSCEGALSRP